jgi:hypothetical protein
VAGDSNGAEDIFVKDLQSGAIQRVSTDAAGVQGNSSSLNAQFSADGRYVVFESYASNLVAGDSNGDWDIFVKDLQSGAIQRVSTDAAGAQGNGYSDQRPVLRRRPHVVFQSAASNLVAGDSNGTGISSSRTCRAGRSSACRPMPPGCRATVTATTPSSPPTAATVVFREQRQQPGGRRQQWRL